MLHHISTPTHGSHKRLLTSATLSLTDVVPLLSNTITDVLELPARALERGASKPVEGVHAERALLHDLLDLNLREVLRHDLLDLNLGDLDLVVVVRLLLVKSSAKSWS